MKLARWRADGEDAYGLIEGDMAYSVSDLFRARFHDLKDVLAADAISDLRADAMTSQPVPCDDITWRLPIQRGARVICVGINYPKRYPLDQSVTRPDNIILFAKLDGTLVPHDAPLEIPVGEAADSFDYEGEIGVMIGRTARHISAADAHAHIAGYTVVNDGSVRDWQRHSVHAGKNFAASGGCGPWITTADEIDEAEKLILTTRLNGQVVQHASASEMYFSISQVVSYISHMIPLVPGDLIAMGSPDGTGGSRTPPRFLKEGDVLEIELSGVGLLRNRVGPAGPR
ncbi:fumarylacetoacetate hydrolase family protein [Nioella aestuarii]|uniref:fumarylacetoacetate hydrolase family protein n=1 Tax=Nioella aestuarii TaxID=1662864 RepID=UPI003D7FF075